MCVPVDQHRALTHFGSVDLVLQATGGLHRWVVCAILQMGTRSGKRTSSLHTALSLSKKNKNISSLHASLSKNKGKSLSQGAAISLTDRPRPSLGVTQVQCYSVCVWLPPQLLVKVHGDHLCRTDLKSSSYLVL